MNNPSFPCDLVERFDDVVEFAVLLPPTCRSSRVAEVNNRDPGVIDEDIAGAEVSMKDISVMDRVENTIAEAPALARH